MPSEKPADRVCAHAVDRLHGKKPGALFPGFDRNKHRALPLGATVSFTGSSAADNGVVPSDQVGKTMDAVPVGHGVSDLALHGAAVIEETPRCLDARRAERPPLSEAVREMAQNHLTRGMLVGTLA